MRFAGGFLALAAGLFGVSSASSDIPYSFSKPAGRIETDEVCAVFSTQVAHFSSTTLCFPCAQGAISSAFDGIILPSNTDFTWTLAPVLKGDAYGFGIEGAARALAGKSRLSAVGIVDTWEARAVRDAGDPGKHDG